MTSGGALADVPSIRSSDQRSSLSRSSGSTPSRSPITIIGSGAATSWTKSQRPARRRASTSSLQIARILGSWSSTRRGVKPLLTSARRRRCSGSSMLIIDGIGGESGASRGRAEGLRVLRDPHDVGVAGDAPHLRRPRPSRPARGRASRRSGGADRRRTRRRRGVEWRDWSERSRPGPLARIATRGTATLGIPGGMRRA